ncbi:MAG TPA: MFS transporter [Blastocatellia bacterium]|nr:MFS transporter [Blastocatellia bacterium]
MGAEITKEQRIPEALRAFRHRNYRIYFAGLFVSFIGTWMQSVAQSWLVYRLTDSAWLLGLVGFASQVPVFLLAPFGGVLADRRSRHRIIIITQALAMVQALLLAGLTLSGRVNVSAVIALASMLGIINAFDMPARQSFVIELVGRKDLINAIGLNSSMINSARIIGPAVAGVIVAWVGEGLCFLINGLSYLAVLGGLFMIRTGRGEVEKPKESALRDFKEGFDFVRRTGPVRALLLLVAFVSIFGLPYIVLMPVFAARILGAGAKGMGILLGAAGLGALAGALTLATRREVRGLGRLVATSSAIFGVMLILFSLSRSLTLSAALLVPIGFTMMLQTSASNTLLQNMVPDRMRGRVMSFFSMSLMGMAPFGSLLAGAAATRFDAPKTVAAGGVLCLLAALVFRLRLPSLRREAVPMLIALGVVPGEPPETDTNKGER